MDIERFSHNNIILEERNIENKRFFIRSFCKTWKDILEKSIIKSIIINNRNLAMYG